MFQVQFDKVPRDYKKILDRIKVDNGPQYKFPKHKTGQRPLQPIITRSKVLHKYEKRIIQLRADISNFNKVETGYKWTNRRQRWMMKFMLKKQKILKTLFGNFFRRARHNYWTRRLPTDEVGEDMNMDPIHLAMWTQKGMGYGMFKNEKLDRMSEDLEKANRIWDDWFLEYRQMIKSKNPMVRNPFEEADIERLKDVTRWIRARDQLPGRQDEIVHRLIAENDQEKAMRKLESKYALRFVKDLFVHLKAQRDALVNRIEKKRRGEPVLDEPPEKIYTMGDIKVRAYEQEFDEFDIGPDLAYQESDIFSREDDVDTGHAGWRHTQFRNKHAPESLHIFEKEQHSKEEETKGDRDHLAKHAIVPELREKLKHRTPQDEEQSRRRIQSVLLEPRSKKSKENTKQALDEMWEKDLEKPLNKTQADFLMQKILEKQKFWEINKLPHKYEDWEKSYIDKLVRDEADDQDRDLDEKDLKKLVDTSIKHRERKMAGQMRKAKRTVYFEDLTKRKRQFEDIDLDTSTLGDLEPKETNQEKIDQLKRAISQVNKYRMQDRRSIDLGTDSKGAGESAHFLKEPVRPKESEDFGPSDKRIQVLLPPITESVEDFDDEEEGDYEKPTKISWILPPVHETGSTLTQYSGTGQRPSEAGESARPKWEGIQTQSLHHHVRVKKKPQPYRRFCDDDYDHDFTIKCHVKQKKGPFDVKRKGSSTPTPREKLKKRSIKPRTMRSKVETLVKEKSCQRKGGEVTFQPEHEEYHPHYYSSSSQTPSRASRSPSRASKSPPMSTYVTPPPRPKPILRIITARPRLEELAKPKKRFGREEYIEICPAPIPPVPKPTARKLIASKKTTTGEKVKPSPKSQSQPPQEQEPPQEGPTKNEIKVVGKKFVPKTDDVQLQDISPPCVIYSERNFLDPRIRWKLEFEERNRARLSTKACEYDKSCECEHQQECCPCPVCYFGDYCI